MFKYSSGRISIGRLRDLGSCGCGFESHRSVLLQGHLTARICGSYPQNEGSIPSFATMTVTSENINERGNIKMKTIFRSQSSRRQSRQCSQRQWCSCYADLIVSDMVMFLRL